MTDLSIPNDENADILTVRKHDAVEVIRIAPDGKLFWKGREVETDKDFRSAMIDLAEKMVPKIPPVGTLVDQKLYNEACSEVERLTKALEVETICHQQASDSNRLKRAEIERLRSVILSAIEILHSPGVMDDWNCEKLAEQLKVDLEKKG